jgi:hypothetical protein
MELESVSEYWLIKTVYNIKSNTNRYEYVVLNVYEYVPLTFKKKSNNKNTNNTLHSTNHKKAENNSIWKIDK